jgi:hypothetical protein
VAVFGAEAFDRLHRFVQHHAVRHVRAIFQFVGGDAQPGALDRIHFVDAAVQMRAEQSVQGPDVGADAVNQIFEVRQIGDLAGLFVRELGDDVAGAGAGHLPSVNRLQGAAPGAGAQYRVYAVRAVVMRLAHGNLSSRFAISMATSAASSPLLPWLPPARASASS